MAFERKADTTQGEVFKFENPGDSITGYYLGSVDHEGDYGPTKKHVFKTPKGVKVCFGQRHLSDLLSDETPGFLVRVTFESTKKTGKGKPMKVFTMDVDRDQRTEEGLLDAASDDSSSITYGDDPVEETPFDEIKTAPAKSYPAPASSDAANRAKIQAELARRSKAKTA